MNHRTQTVAARSLALTGLLTLAGAAVGQACDDGWSALGAGLLNKDKVGSAIAQPIVFDDGNGPALYALGHTYFADGLPVDHFARWDGQAWTAPLGGGLTEATEGNAVNVFDALIRDDGSVPAIFAGGRVKKAGG